MPAKSLATDEEVIEKLKTHKPKEVAKICKTSVRRVYSLGRKAGMEFKRPHQQCYNKEIEPRSNESNWINYMKENPFYFSSIFKMAPTEQNILEQYNELGIF